MNEQEYLIYQMFNEQEELLVLEDNTICVVSDRRIYVGSGEDVDMSCIEKEES